MRSVWVTRATAIVAAAALLAVAVPASASIRRPGIRSLPRALRLPTPADRVHGPSRQPGRPRLGAALDAARRRATVGRAVEAADRPLTRWQKTKVAVHGAATRGTRHTWHSIQHDKVRFGAGLLGMGAIGAVAAAFGAPLVGLFVALGLSTTAVIAQIRTAMPKLRSAKTETERWQVIGAEMLWPTVLAVGTSALGHFGVSLFDHFVHIPPGTPAVTAAGIESAAIGFDAPAVGVTALDNRRERKSAEAGAAVPAPAR